MTDFNQVLGEGLSLLDASKKEVGKNIINTLTLNSGLQRIVGFNRSFSEAMTLGSLGYVGAGGTYLLRKPRPMAFYAF